MLLDRLKTYFNRSLLVRLTLLITILTAVLTISFTTYYVYHERRMYFSHLQSEGNLLASILARSIQTPLYAGLNEEIALHVSAIFSQGNVCCVKIVNNRGEQIAYAVKDGHEPSCKGMPFSKSIVTTSRAFSPGALLLGEETTEQLIGTVHISLDTGQADLLVRKLLIISTLQALAFWFFATGLTVLLLRKMTSTFQLLMTGVKQIEAGVLNARIPVNTFDEPGRALDAINNLAEALQKRNEENATLQAEVVKGLRLQIDEEKKRHMAKLIQTNRMTSLGLLVSSMAHEINNPNAAIRLGAEILERAWSDVRLVLDELAGNEGDFKICGMPYTEAIEDVEQAVDAISRSSVRIEKVVHNLRSYNVGDREKQHTLFNINRVAENSIAIVRAHGSMSNITINTSLSDDLPFVSGNPFQVEQVIINLLLNAIQAMSINDGKNISLFTEHDSATAEVKLVVKDSGPGIKEENLANIFEPFFSTRIDQGGSGLGLYISDFIVKEQNGSLEIINVEGGGCQAVIRMPAATSLYRSTSPELTTSC